MKQNKQLKFNKIPALVKRQKIFNLLCKILSTTIFSRQAGKIVAGLDINTIELFRANKLKNIYKILNDGDIEIAPLKGVCLAYNYYPHPALRIMGDFDILVMPGKVSKAFQLMVDNGFKSDFDLKNDFHEPTLFSPRGYALELHTRIGPLVKNCSPEILWNRFEEKVYKGRKFCLLRPEFSILHTINHAFKDHLVGGFRPFTDVACILAASNITLEQLKNCAEKFGTYNKFCLFMNILPDFFPIQS